jgi:transcriptional regulator with XRE-family HTH domain
LPVAGPAGFVFVRLSRARTLRLFFTGVAAAPITTKASDRGNMPGEYVRAALGGNLRKLRKHREWSQMELAQKANISLNFLSEIERGQKWPYPGTLENLASALGVEVHEFFKSKENGVNLGVEAYINRFSNDIASAVEESVQSALFDVKRRYDGKLL